MSKQTAIVENCDTFNPAVWGLDSGSVQPVVQAGTWVFNFPAKTARMILPMSKQELGYGTYELKFKMSGHKPNSQRYYFYLIYNPGSPTNPAYNELDAFEKNYTELRESYSFIRNGVKTAGIYYKASINYEDGGWHIWKFVYTPTLFETYIDNVLQVHIPEKTPPIIPVPPMFLLFGGENNGTVATAFTLTVDSFTYTPTGAPPSNPCQTYIDQIADQQTQIAALTAQIASLGIQITALKAKIAKALTDLGG